MRFEAVTTFSAEGLRLYGLRMIDTFSRHWPIEVPLTVYREGWGPTAVRPATRDLMHVSQWLAAFKTRHARRSTANFRFDAVRFAHKVAALHHATLHSEADVLIWLDGDIVTHADIGVADLAHLAPSSTEWAAWLDRENLYPECGFLMLNRRHPRHLEGLLALVELYCADTLFELAEWHDSFALEHVVKALGLPVKSLSGVGFATSHPLVNGPLGQWFDHLKGPRKAEGRSRASDLKVARSEPHWAGADK